MNRKITPIISFSIIILIIGIAGSAIFLHGQSIRNDFLSSERIERIHEEYFINWEVYKNEEYEFEFRYPFQVEIIKITDHSQEILLSLLFKHEYNSFIFNGSNQEEWENGFRLNIIDLNLKNEWKTYSTGYGTLIYELKKDKWNVDGIICDFSPDIEYPSREKFIATNETWENSLVLKRLKECAEFYSSFIVPVNNVYHFSNSNIVGYGQQFIILNKEKEYALEFSYNYLYDEMLSPEQNIKKQ